MERKEIARIVYEKIAAILPVSVDEISGEDHIRDLGADSVDRVEIILSLIDRFKICEPLAAFAAIKNINGLVEFLWERNLSDVSRG